MPDVPKPAFPLEFVGGRLRVVEQDSPDEIEQCVEVIMRTEKGERLALPGFGITDPTFRMGGPDLDDITAAIVESEPRAVFSTTVQLEDVVARVSIRMQDASSG